VIEESSPVTLPPGFETIECRDYGDARLTFARRSG
jgi:hypothetical protein